MLRLLPAVALLLATAPLCHAAAPVVAPGQTFEVEENTTSGSPAGVDPIEGSSVSTAAASAAATSFAIQTGNDAGFFSINHAGLISINGSADFDFENPAKDSFTLGIVATNADGSSPAVNVQINIIDVDEAPVIAITPSALPIGLPENSRPSPVVTVSSTDPEGEPVSYSIISITANNGSDATGAFVINAATGAITVGDISKIDYEAQLPLPTPPAATFTIRVGATETGAGPDEADLSSSFDIPVNLIDVDPEPLVISNQAYTFDDKSDPIGTVEVVNGENRTKTFSIASQKDSVGNSVAFFQIDPVSGEISSNASDTEFRFNNPFILRVVATPGTPLAGETPAAGDITLNYLSNKLPGGNPLMLAVGEHLVDITPGSAGSVYGLVRLSNGTIQLRVFDEAFSRQLVIPVTGASDPSTVEGIAVAGQHLIVTLKNTILRYDVAKLADYAPNALAPAVPLTVNVGDVRIRDLAVKNLADIWYVYVCGQSLDNGQFFWRRYRVSDLAAGTIHKWGFTTETIQLKTIVDRPWHESGDYDIINSVTLPITSAANYRLFSIEVDSAGNAYIAGSWRDPLYDRAVGGNRAYGVQASVPGGDPSTPKLTFGRGGYDTYSKNGFGTKFWRDATYPQQPQRITGFVYKFSSSGTYEAGRHDGGSGEDSYTQSFVRDLEVTEDNGQTSVHAVMQYRGSGTLGAEARKSTGYQSVGVFPNAGQIFPNIFNAGLTVDLGSYDIKVMRFDGNLEPATTNDAVAASAEMLLGGVEEREISISVDPQGSIYLMAAAPDQRLRFTSSSNDTDSLDPISPASSRYIAAQLDRNCSWQWVELFGLGTYTPRNAYPRAALSRWHGDQNAVLLAGNLANGSLRIVDGNKSNTVSDKAFFTFISSAQDFVGNVGMTIISEFGDSGVHVHPFEGTQTKQPGDAIEAYVPEIIYFEDLAGVMVPMGSFDTPPTEDAIEQRAVMRAISTGYTVADISGDSQLPDFSDPSNRYTFIFERNTQITFNWKVEYALEIKSNLAGTGATVDTEGNWAVGTLTGLGLTSTAAGNPVPAVQKHWVAENEIVTGFIDGSVPDAEKFGTRYVVDGWSAGGSASASVPANGINLQARQQVPQFVMDGPATLTYNWRIQHRVQVSTSNSATQDAPQIRVGTGFAAPAVGTNGFGSGEHWFDRNSTLRIGSLSSIAGKELTGWLNATAPFSPESSPSALPGVSSDSSFVYVQAPPLVESIRVSWNYNDTIYRVSTTIGEVADLSSATNSQGIALSSNATALGEVEISPGVYGPPNHVTLVDSPPASTSPDMQIWDDVANQVLPLRPGIFFLEWDKNGDGIRTIVQVTSTFPSEGHFRHLYAPEIPKVELDPEADDAVAFLDLKYTNGNAAATGGQFESSSNGFAVLLFSRSDTPAATGGPASGNLNRETLQVRVAQTIVWDGMTFGDGTTEALPTQATIATRVPSVVGGKNYDKAGIGTGFVVYPNARYNANIHDRSLVADAGPIIPVNRHFEAPDAGSINRNDLVVFWYQKQDGMLWPDSSIKYNAVWPTGVPANAPALPAIDSDYLRRIVIASRLGSEGADRRLDSESLDLIPRGQLSFSPARFSDVAIYNQPRRDLPGFNPNEEHGVIAPSFKFLNQANPPPTAYALRRDLNVITQGGGYTSDPYVLVEYFDSDAGDDGEFRMAIYAIQYEDPTIPILDVDLTDEDTANDRSFPYVFRYPMLAGEPVQPPYPLGQVIGLSPCEQTIGFNLGLQRSYWEDHKGQAWAVSDGALGSQFYYPLALDFWGGEGASEVFPGTCVPFITAGSIRNELVGDVANPTFVQDAQFEINGTQVTINGTSAAAFIAAVNALNGPVSASQAAGAGCGFPIQIPTVASSSLTGVTRRFPPQVSLSAIH